jgi:hypothetical protein
VDETVTGSIPVAGFGIIDISSSGYVPRETEKRTRFLRVLATSKCRLITLILRKYASVVKWSHGIETVGYSAFYIFDTTASVSFLPNNFTSNRPICVKYDTNLMLLRQWKPSHLHFNSWEDWSTFIYLVVTTAKFCNQKLKCYKQLYHNTECSI